MVGQAAHLHKEATDMFGCIIVKISSNSYAFESWVGRGWQRVGLTVNMWLDCDIAHLISTSGM